MIVVGLMSGTSADGIDAAVVELSGAPPDLQWRLIKHILAPHTPELRSAIFAAFRPETATVDRLCELNFELGRAFGRAALTAITAAGLPAAAVDLIGSHGQTVWHAPAGSEPSTLQLGEAAVIAEMVAAPVVSNFRARDMAAGGQGAPLVAHVDELLFAHPALTRALQNIGGIANVTYLRPAVHGRDAVRLAFDTGPGNMLIDEMARRATGGRQPYDRDGALAAAGRVDEGLLAALMADPYLALPPPKTTGRERFGVQYAERVWQDGLARGLAAADIVATVTAFTAGSIADAYRRFLPAPPDEVILSGGGAKNPVLVAMLGARLVDMFAPEGALEIRMTTSAELGLPEDAKEAVAFAVLAYETWHGRAGNAPWATGARHPVVLGSITPANTGQPSPAAESVQASAPIGTLTTETRNPATERIDALPTLEMVRVINREDHRVAEAVEAQLPAIARAIDAIAERMQRGGRLIYVGAGTSGRLGVLDASECPPTFSTKPGQVLGIIAGGLPALTHSIEGEEDDDAAGAADLLAAGVAADDSVVGIAASGRTPYVLGALRAARAAGALTVGVACNPGSSLAGLSDIEISLVVGPEVVTGSTRLKAGTAQKMTLNMLSTGVMIRLGKTYGNLMVDVQPTNAKLRDRARRIVESACGVPADKAGAELEQCGGETKTAIVCLLRNVDPDTARSLLRATGGRVRDAVAS